MGVYSRLDQVFDAPYAVKEVLIGQANLESSVCFCFSSCLKLTKKLFILTLLCIFVTESLLIE